MDSSPSALLHPIRSASAKTLSTSFQCIRSYKVRRLFVKCSNLKVGIRASRTGILRDEMNFVKRKDLIGLVFGVSNPFLDSFEAKGAGLPPEQKPRLCYDNCEKELENVPIVTAESGLQYTVIKVGQGHSSPVGFQVASNYIAMIFSGQIFDSSLEKGQPYIFCVGSGQVVKGLDEGILTMKVGGKRRHYIPGPLAFPKGLVSVPGRPKVAANSPVIFDVSLEYIPGVEVDKEKGASTFLYVEIFSVFLS